MSGGSGDTGEGGALRLGRQADALRRAAVPSAGAGAGAGASGPIASPAPPWLAVTGAKGGVGKTLVAVNLALLLAQKGYRTLLVDLDPGCGNVDVHLRLPRRWSLDDAVAGRCTPEAAVVDGPAGLRVLAGRSGADDLCAADPERLRRTFAAVDAAARGSDLVVCDTGAGLGPVTLAAAERAQAVLGLVTPDPAAITDAYAQCKLLHQRGRPLPRLVLNGVTSRDEAMRTAGRFATVCRRFLGADAPLCGWLRRDEGLAQSALQQRPFALAGHGPALDELRALCAAALAALPSLPRRPVRGVAAVAV
ncbi:MAG: AAA family ATPase [Planctomycetota bacterium]